MHNPPDGFPPEQKPGRFAGRFAGRVAALDVGEVRTGVAISDETRFLARPLEVVASGELADYLAALVREYGISEVVVGVPKTLGGEVGLQARRVLDTIAGLKVLFPGTEFVEWDERFTTRVARGGTPRGGKRRRKAGTKERVDHLAAARILQEYLDSRGRVEAPR